MSFNLKLPMITFGPGAGVPDHIIGKRGLMISARVVPGVTGCEAVFFLEDGKTFTTMMQLDLARRMSLHGPFCFLTESTEAKGRPAGLGIIGPDGTPLV